MRKQEVPIWHLRKKEGGSNNYNGWKSFVAEKNTLCPLSFIAFLYLCAEISPKNVGANEGIIFKVKKEPKNGVMPPFSDALPNAEYITGEIRFGAVHVCMYVLQLGNIINAGKYG